jgi:hypothetical protein
VDDGDNRARNLTPARTASPRSSPAAPPRHAQVGLTEGNGVGLHRRNPVVLTGGHRAVGGDEEPRDSGGERRFIRGGSLGPAPTPAPMDPRAQPDAAAVESLTCSANCRTSKQLAGKSRNRAKHQKEADFNPNQHAQSSSGKSATRRSLRAGHVSTAPTRLAHGPARGRSLHNPEATIFPAGTALRVRRDSPPEFG